MPQPPFINERQFTGAGASQGPWQRGNNLRPMPLSPARGTQNQTPKRNQHTDGELDPERTIYVYDKTRYLNFQSDYRVLGAGEVDLLLSEPQNIRAALSVRVASTSIGSLAIAFNQQLQDTDQAEWVINPGGSSQGLWDYIIPQNRLYAYASGGEVRYKVVWAEAQVKR